MHKIRLRILIPTALLALALALSLISSVSGLAPTVSTGVQVTARTPEITPTPADTGVSQAGSTDGIMWVGIIIVVIILLPIVFRKATWGRA